ncbi:hypothetical protein QUB40_09495, partial [Microcoleus sp. AT9_A2]|uniref:hypothetical protein n=1 Tax=Microcoleus sp. AT9_A2 TaxID=2818624 RepID=UPI002FD52577
EFFGNGQDARSTRMNVEFFGNGQDARSTRMNVEFFGNGQDARSTRMLNFCGTGILPVANLFEEASINFSANPESAC